MQDALDRLATRQHGLVGLWQLSSLGFGPSIIQRWMTGRRLVRVHEGVYRLRGAPET
jgi:hypothetical protein